MPNITTDASGVRIQMPTGNTHILTKAEEREIAKAAVKEHLINKMTRYSEFEKAVLNAIGLAIGAFIAGWLIGRKR